MIPDTLNIIHAELLGGYRLSLGFDDGSTQIVHFEPFLAASAHPCDQGYSRPGPFCILPGRTRRSGVGRLRPLLPDCRFVPEPDRHPGG